MAAKKCESSSEDSSSEEEEGVTIRQSGNLLPPWWPTSSVETEAGRKFWLMPELMDRLLLMLDARSMLSLAEVQPLAVRILRGGSQPWRKLIKEALDNPVFEQQRTLIQKIATTVLAKMESPQSLTLELLDLICAEYNDIMGWVARGRKGACASQLSSPRFSHSVRIRIHPARGL